MSNEIVSSTPDTPAVVPSDAAATSATTTPAMPHLAEFNKMWEEFQGKYQRLLDGIGRQLGNALGVVESGNEPATDEERRAAFGGMRPSLERVADGIASGRFKSIVVCCGAGMSTSAGIPDFRSPGTGLYAKLGSELSDVRPEDMFSISYYRSNPMFFTLRAKDMWPGTYQPTAAHRFLKHLHDEGILRRVYTQNIDTLEHVAGLPDDVVVYCHGNFRSASCIDCKAPCPIEDVRVSIVEKETPHVCARCDGGMVKPDIVFFGESLPPRFTATQKDDFGACDLLLVIGSSLVVMPFASLPQKVGNAIPRVLFNRDLVGTFQAIERRENYRDVSVLGDIDASCNTLLEMVRKAKEKRKGTPSNNSTDNDAVVSDVTQRRTINTKRHSTTSSSAAAALLRSRSNPRDAMSTREVQNHTQAPVLVRRRTTSSSRILSKKPTLVSSKKIPSNAPSTKNNTTNGSSVSKTMK